MIPYLKGLLYDPKSFANFIRVGIFLLGELLTNIPVGGKGWYLGQFAKAFALLVRAGDKNPA